MKASFTLLLILSFLLSAKADNTYSIDSILNFLQEKGYYDILVQVKSFYGIDVSIEICKSFIPSVDCDQIVKIYINVGGRARTRGGESETETLENLVLIPESDIKKLNMNYVLNTIQTIKKKYNIN